MAETIRFEGLTLPVSDVARSIEFYRLLGFEVEVSRPIFALLRLGEGDAWSAQAESIGVAKRGP